jgi:putative glutathione S-transferase
MGMLIDGKWTIGSIVRSDKKGAYDRLPRTFREYISQNNTVYKPESGRYHLYVSYACPWACRTLIYRQLKGLEQHISVSVVHPDMMENGWFFDENYGGSTEDHLFGLKYLSEVYQKADTNITTSVTVPVLWDKKNKYHSK